MVRRNLFLNCGIDKKKLKGVVARLLEMDQDFAVVELLEMLKRVGFQHATEAGSSIGLDDLLTPPSKDRLMLDAELYILWGKIHQNQGLLSLPEQAYRGLLLWQKINETLKQQVVDHFYSTDILNPVYMMAFSGARGNITQVHQLVGMRGLMADPEGNLIDFPIKSNFREGLTLTEYLISCFGARKGVVDTALRTATAGYLTRRLVDVSHHIVVATPDCLTTRGLLLRALSKDDKVVSTLTDRLTGRVLAETVVLETPPTPPTDREWFLCFNADKKWQHAAIERARVVRERKSMMDRNQPISPLDAERLAKVRDEVLVRSPLTCDTVQSICRLCYGWGLAYGRLIQLGQAVGVIAGQSIGEPGTQLTMRTFHTGGVFSGHFTENLLRAPCSGRVWLPNRLKGWLARTSGGELAFFLCRPLVLQIHPLRGPAIHIQIKPSTLLVVRNGQTVTLNQVLAEYAETSFFQTKEEKLLGVDLGGYLYTSQLPLPVIALTQKPNSPVKLLSGRVLFRQPLPFTPALHQPQDPAHTGDALDQKTAFLTSRVVGRKTGFLSLTRQLRHTCLIPNNDSQPARVGGQTRVRKQKAGGFAVGQTIPAVGQPVMREAATVGPVGLFGGLQTGTSKHRQTRKSVQDETKVGEPFGLDPVTGSMSSEPCFRETGWYTPGVRPTDTLFAKHHLPHTPLTPWGVKSVLPCKQPRSRGNPHWRSNNPTPQLRGCLGSNTGQVFQLGFATPLVSLVFKRVDYREFGYYAQAARRLKPTQAVFRTSLSENYPLCQELANRFGLQILSARWQSAGEGISWGDSLYFNTGVNCGSFFSLREDWHELRHRGVVWNQTRVATGLMTGPTDFSLQPVSPSNQPGWAQLVELVTTEKWQTSGRLCLLANSQTGKEKGSSDGQSSSDRPNVTDRQSASFFRLSAGHTSLSRVCLCLLANKQTAQTGQSWGGRVGRSLHAAHHLGVGWEKTQVSGLKPPGNGISWMRVSHPLVLGESPRWVAIPTSPLPTSHILLCASVKSQGGCLLVPNKQTQASTCFVCSDLASESMKGQLGYNKTQSKHGSKEVEKGVRFYPNTRLLFTTLWQKRDAALPSWKRCGLVEAAICKWLPVSGTGSPSKSQSQRMIGSKMFACFVCVCSLPSLHANTDKNKQTHVLSVHSSSYTTTQQEANDQTRGSCQFCLCLRVEKGEGKHRQKEVGKGNRLPPQSLKTVFARVCSCLLFGNNPTTKQNREGMAVFKPSLVAVVRADRPWSIAERQEQGGGMSSALGVKSGWVCLFKRKVLMARKHLARRHVARRDGVFFRVGQQIGGGVHGLTGGSFGNQHLVVEWVRHNPSLLLASKTDADRVVSASPVLPSSPPLHPRSCDKSRLFSIRHRFTRWGSSLGLFQACLKRATASSPNQKELGDPALLRLLRQLFAREEETAFANKKVICNNSCRWGLRKRKRLTISRVGWCLTPNKSVSQLSMSTSYSPLFQLGDGPVLACTQTQSWLQNGLRRLPALALIRKMVELPRRSSPKWKREVSTLLQVETYSSPKQELSPGEQQPKRVFFDITVSPPSQPQPVQFVFSICPPISPDLGIRLAPLGRGSCLVRQGFSSKQPLLAGVELANQTAISFACLIPNSPADLTRMVNTASLSRTPTGFLPDRNPTEWHTARTEIIQQEDRKSLCWGVDEAYEEHLRETGWGVGKELDKRVEAKSDGDAGKGVGAGSLLAGRGVSRGVQVWYTKETSLLSLFATMDVVTNTPLSLTGCQSRLAAATPSFHLLPPTRFRDGKREGHAIQKTAWGGIPLFTLSSFNPLPLKLSDVSMCDLYLSSVYSENRSQLVVRSLLAVRGELTTHTSLAMSRLLLTHAEQVGLGLASSSPNLLVSDVLQRGQSTGLTLVAPKDGKVVQVERDLAILQNMAALPRGGKSTILINPDRVVTPGAPFMAFSTFQHKTEDIVQGIPKIEQLFEGRAEIEKDLLRRELNALSQENLQHYPNPEALAKSYEKIQIMVVEAIQHVYLSQSVSISDKHIEIVVKQMTLSVYMHNANQEFGYLFPIPVNLVQFSKSFHFGLGVDRPAFQQRFRDRVARREHRKRLTTVGKPAHTASSLLITTFYGKRERSRRGLFSQRPTLPFALLVTTLEGRRSTTILGDLWLSAQPKSLPFWSYRPGGCLESNTGVSTPKTSGQATKSCNKQKGVVNLCLFGNKQKVRWVCAPLLVGITQAALSSRSFLSAASFQQTVLVLGRSASAGRTDFLRGIKERGAVGESMISGTGNTTLFPLLRELVAADWASQRTALWRELVAAKPASQQIALQNYYEILRLAKPLTLRQ